MPSSARGMPQILTRVRVARDVDAVERLYRRLRLALCGAKRREVALAEKRRGSGAHRFDRQGAMVPAGPVMEQRRAYRPVEQQIRVMASCGGEPRVELRAD